MGDNLLQSPISWLLNSCVWHSRGKGYVVLRLAVRQDVLYPDTSRVNSDDGTKFGIKVKLTTIVPLWAGRVLSHEWLPTPGSLGLADTRRHHPATTRQRERERQRLAMLIINDIVYGHLCSR